MSFNQKRYKKIKTKQTSDISLSSKITKHHSELVRNIVS